MNSPWQEFKLEVAIVDPFPYNALKNVYSFIHHAGKSRGDRVYVNEENVPNVTNHKYLLTPFSMAHKILSLLLKINRTGAQATGNSMRVY